jgi:hypothetical protein
VTTTSLGPPFASIFRDCNGASCAEHLARARGKLSRAPEVRVQMTRAPRKPGPCEIADCSKPNLSASLRRDVRTNPRRAARFSERDDRPNRPIARWISGLLPGHEIYGVYRGVRKRNDPRIMRRGNAMPPMPKRCIASLRYLACTITAHHEALIIITVIILIATL